MTSTRQVRDYFCHTMQQVENRVGDHTFHELFDTWLNEVKAEAWHEGVMTALNSEGRSAGERARALLGNPYRKDEE